MSKQAEAGSSAAGAPRRPAGDVPEFEPRIIGFLCNWCAYAGADKAGVAQNPYPVNVHVIRVMCSGRVDPRFIMQAFARGADGVLVLACHPGDCHYKEGNLRAAGRLAMLHCLLEQLGIERGRCRFAYVSAAEGEKYQREVAAMTADLKTLGPLKLS